MIHGCRKIPNAHQESMVELQFSAKPRNDAIISRQTPIFRSTPKKASELACTTPRSLPSLMAPLQRSSSSTSA
jgi:hypothetical protein